MKQLVKNYTFNVTAKTVTLGDFSSGQPVRLDRLLLIVDTTTNQILYNYADSSVSEASISSNNVVTLTALPSGPANADSLAIFYEMSTGDPVYDGGQRTSANSHPVVIASDQSTLPISGVVAVSGSVAVTGSFYPATQAVSVSSLPLPTGAAQEGGNLATLAGAVSSSKLQTNVAQVGGSALSLGQQLAAASLPVVLTSAQLATLTPYGAVTANAGTNLNTSALALETGGNLATVAANTSRTDLTVTGSAAANATPFVSMTLTGQSTYTFVLSGTFSASVQVQVSVDGTTFSNMTSNLSIWNMLTGVTVTGTISSAGTYRVSCAGLAAIRLITTAYSSGTINATAHASYAQDSNQEGAVQAIQSGNWTVGANSSLSSGVPSNAFFMGYQSAAATLIPVKSAAAAGANNGGDAELAAVGYGQYSSAPAAITSGNYSAHQLDKVGQQLVTVGGQTTTAVAAGTSANTVIKSTGGRLCRVLVTATGTNAMSIYDNSTTNSGTIIGALPASPAVGSVYDFQMPAASGITIAGNSSNPGVTMSWV
jgi:hypothetical protein